MDPLGTTGATAASRLVGRYLVSRRIAAGGMATVHLGRLLGAAGFSRTVAIKRLHDGYARDPEFVAMLLDEARLASQIRHPNVVPTLDVVAEQDELLVVMEYVDGDSLSHLAKLVHQKGERLPIPLACAIVAQTLHGLHAAHEAKDKYGEPLGIVHRDVSPQNVLVGTDGVARVLDFGIAKAASRATATEDGQIKGKTAYMAPEQLGHGSVDRRTDVWAAAVMFWEVLTGKRLFLSDSPAQTMARIVGDVIDPPSRWSPDVPPELSMICLRGLEREKEGRFETAEEMALAIEDAVGFAMPRAKELGAWVRETAQAVLEERAALVREVEHEEAPDIGAQSTTDPALRAAMEEAERRRNISDLPTNMGTPRARAFARDVVNTPRTGPVMPPAVGVAPGTETTDLNTVRSSNHDIVAPDAQGVSRLSIVLGIGGGIVLAALVAMIFVLVRSRHVEAQANPSPPPPAVSTTDPIALELPSSSAIPAPPPTATATPAPSTTTRRPVWRPPGKKQPDCRIPYDVDAKGNKHFRQECL